jgi:3-(3-hydroxy-phenyl)propionate hydroxylase
LASDPTGTTVALHARYAIVADGARSVCREALQVAFSGYTHPEQFLVAGTRYDFKGVMKNIQSVNYTSDPEEWFLLLEIPDVWRIVVPVPETIAANEARSAGHIQQCLQNICPSERPYEILVNSVYRVHQRIAERYRAASAFLAGDAAHINNPLGEMGLNGGIHDALLLIDLLLEGLSGGDIACLDRYEAARRPVAISDINTATERNKRQMEERDPRTRQANNERLRAQYADPDSARQLALEVSMIRSLRDAGMLPASA